MQSLDVLCCRAQLEIQLFRRTPLIEGRTDDAKYNYRFALTGKVALSIIRLLLPGV